MGERLIEVVHGDCREVLAQLEDASVDSVVTDPPYELGFMGKAWDASGVAYDVAMWREVLRVLKPGGHLCAFGGTRTYHRMACAIEDAGFEIRDSLSWLYGTGFPKSLNLGDGRGTALKPACEPIVLARKPFKGTVAANVQEHGTGGINVDGCRIGTAKGGWGGGGGSALFEGGLSREGGEARESVGRWPANVLLDEEAAAMLDEQSGERKSGERKSGEYGLMGYQGADVAPMPAVQASTGGASRFFYTAKASRSEREAGLDAFPKKSAAELTDRGEDSDGLKSPRAGAGRTSPGRANDHPTVKPISLMRWLVRLITPPGGLVLDPFTGSGTTGIAAKLEGFDFIGIEREEEYVKIAEARIAHAKED